MQRQPPEDWPRPEILFAEDHSPCRIYGDDRETLWALVDRADYQFLIQWRWSPKFSRGAKKFYLRRNVQVGIKSCRVQKTLFLHTAVMQRMGCIPPTEKHILVDHINGDGLDCRRANLRWATHSMNRRNVKGRDSETLHFRYRNFEPDPQFTSADRETAESY